MPGSERARKEIRPPQCLITDCWCMRLQCAVLLIALLTAGIAAILFVYYLYHFMYGVWGTDLFHLQRSLDRHLNNSMFRVSNDFNRASERLCRIRGWLTSAAPHAGRADGRGPPHRARPVHLHPDDIPRAFIQSYPEDDVARMAVGRQDFDTPDGYFRSKEFRRAFREWNFRRRMDAKQNGKFRFKRKSRNFATQKRRRGMIYEDLDLCSPFLQRRRSVGQKMNDVRTKMTKVDLQRLDLVIAIMCGIGMALCVAAMLASGVLVLGVVHNDPKLVVPWLLVAGFFGIFHLTFFVCRIGMRAKATTGWRVAVGFGLVLLIIFGLAIVTLAIYAVSSFFYIIFTAPMFLHHFRNTAQLVVSARAEEGSADSAEQQTKSGCLRRPWRGA